MQKEIIKSESFEIAKSFLGSEVEVTIDRPIGSKHPKHGFVYEVNYGYVEGVKAPDGEDIDVYYLGKKEPIQKKKGICIAIVHRKNDDDDKLIVVPPGVDISDEEISKSVAFQERWFDTKIVREEKSE